MKAKKITSVLLAVLTVISVLPVTAFAALKKPIIKSQPKGGYFCCEKSEETYSVTATGDLLGYEWHLVYVKNGKPTDIILENSEDGTILGAITSNLTLRDFELCKLIGVTHGKTVTASAELYCKVFNASGSVMTKKVNIIDCPSPYIYGEPQDAKAKLGGAAIFSVEAVAGGSLDYYWYRIDGKGVTECVDELDPSKFECSDNKLIIKNVTRDDIDLYHYFCRVEDCESDETYDSDYAKIQKTEPVYIVKQPEDVRQYPGVSAKFSIEVTGDDVKYQWYKSTLGDDGNWSSMEKIEGAVERTYSYMTSLAESGKVKFKCEVFNSVSTMQSTYGTLYAITPPKITKEPSDVTVAEGGTAKFTAEAEGEGLKYQWEVRIKKANGTYSNWDAVDNATFSAYTVSSAKLVDNGTQYRCIVTNSDNARSYSEIATLYVIKKDAQPVITKQPENTEVFEGRDAIFSVEAAGSELEYEWHISRKGGDGSWSKWKTAPGNATASEYIYSGAKLEDGGNVKFECVVSNKDGVTSITDEAFLSVKANIIIKKHPENVTVKEGDVALFSTEADGEDLSYRWQVSYSSGRDVWRPFTDAVDSSNSAAYIFKDTAYTNNGNVKVRCIISNAYGSVTTNEAKLYVEYVDTETKITSQPVDSSVTEGDTAAFSVEATGLSLTYQWYKNGEKIKNAVSASYVFKAEISDDGAKYKCEVIGTNGTVISNEATLTVAARVIAPTVKNHPADASVKEGESVTFTVSAEGTALNYRWYRNGAAIDGANGASYTFTAALGDNGAKYTCVVSNSAGTVTSNEAVLTVAAKSEPKPMLLLGNVSGDGRDGSVSVSDARLVLRAAVALETFTGIKAFLADVDGKDGITVADARLTLRMAVSLDPLKFGNNY